MQRAAKTAAKIRDAQLTRTGNERSVQGAPDVVQLPLLVEQDFGSLEGKKFYERPADSKMTGKEHHRLEHVGVSGFVDVESKDSMARRADTFLDGHLLPLLDDGPVATEMCIGIVSHGIFLSTLWKRLLLRLPPKSVVLSSELQATARPYLEHLGGWSNTGYLELMLTQREVPSLPVREKAPPSPSLSNRGRSLAETPAIDHRSSNDSEANSSEKPVLPKERVDKAVESVSKTPVLCAMHGWDTTILVINGKDHLKGLKRTGGGVGSSRHDASQKSIESFFKRRKVE